MEVVELLVSFSEKRLTSKIGFSFDIKTKHNAAVEVRRRETMMAMMGIERTAILLAMLLEGTIGINFNIQVWYRL